MRERFSEDLRTVLRSASVLATAVGVGRFVFTPILPLMQSQAGLTAELGATMATADYVGFAVAAIGALLLRIRFPHARHLSPAIPRIRTRA